MTWRRTIRAWWVIGRTQRQVFWLWVFAIGFVAFIPVFIAQRDWAHALQVTGIAIQTAFAARVMRWMCIRIERDEQRWKEEEAARKSVERLSTGEDQAL